jgi:CheY-like chemotaxis protein
MAKLLPIDNNEMNLGLLWRRPKMKGHAAMCATNRIQGIGMANREKSDPLPMDPSMPQLNGRDAARQLRHAPSAAPLTRAIPIVAAASHALKGDRERGSAPGCPEFVSKPLDFDKLDGAIERLLTGRMS